MEEEIKQLKLEIVSLKEQLSKYTNPDRYKKYYEANKQKINESRKEYLKEYYQKKKIEKAKKIE